MGVEHIITARVRKANYEESNKKDETEKGEGGRHRRHGD